MTKKKTDRLILPLLLGYILINMNLLYTVKAEENSSDSTKSVQEITLCLRSGEVIKGVLVQKTDDEIIIEGKEIP